eukprot:Phypoly_transcript_09616.p1 GENE.Phypoly_transcript_09616~~Phypoly_transcript_09616.p1  ORF type:complete len:271 (+),score=41.02 Phypoly_transcript_09616:513-1325(+)
MHLLFKQQRTTWTQVCLQACRNNYRVSFDFKNVYIFFSLITRVENFTAAYLSKLEMACELATQERQYQTLLVTNRTLAKELEPKRKQNEILKKDIQNTKAKVQAKEEELAKENENLQLLARRNQRLNSENIKLEQRLDMELNARGLSRMDFRRLCEMERQVTQMSKERARLRKENEELRAKWDQVAQKREMVVRELISCKEESKRVVERHQEIRKVQAKLENELEMKEQKAESCSLAGRLKRRLEALQHEHLELKRTKLELQQNQAPYSS